MQDSKRDTGESLFSIPVHLFLFFVYKFICVTFFLIKTISDHAVSTAGWWSPAWGAPGGLVVNGLPGETKLQYFGHLIRRTDSLEKTLMLGKIESRGEGDGRGWDGWMASPTQWTWVWVSSRSWCDGPGSLACCSSAAAATAKSLQSCPTLCNPIDGSPPGSPIPGILQVRTLEWVAISFSNAWKWKVKVKSLSRVRLLATPWTAAYQAPLSMDSPGKNTGVGCHALPHCYHKWYCYFP